MKKIACAIFWVFLVQCAWAAPEEIQVYLDEFASKGEFGLDIHTNYVSALQPNPASTVTRKMLRTTPELSYGLTKNWEIAGYWLTSKGPDQANNTLLSDGIKARLKWRPDSSVDAASNGSPWYWAINFEMGKVNPRFNPDQRTAQMKWIGLYKKSHWTLGVNLNFDRALVSGGGLPQGTTRELDTKLAYNLGSIEKPLSIGFENYAYRGAISGPLAGLNKTQTTFVVADFELEKWDFNIGVGRATGVTDDKVVIKAVIGVPF